MEANERIPPGQGVTRGWPVLHVGAVPPHDAETWRLRVHGEVEHARELSWSDFMALRQSRVEADMHCVTGWSKLDNRWDGVLVSELAERVRVRSAARFVRFADGVHFDTTVPLEVALRSDVILAHSHDGVPLAPAHGGPLRAVVPSLYAWKSCKWVREVEFLSAERLGFWEVRGYHNDADPWREERFV